ncbi:MAG: protein translocase subunit SecF [Planctomycetota bacterium]|nr:MAG: protein translocase subunit SecF [Planctomycetota bacterium]
MEAALGQEKSLSKVVRFAPQIAGQTRNRAVFAIVLALAAIVSYLWLRFGTKEYGLAAIVALVHDVSVTLGMVALCHFISDTVVGKALLLDAFRVDLPMVAAILTVIGYSLNDTIVVFDRIRENKGRIEALNPKIINASINQCMSRTLLTSITTFLVVLVLYAFGGAGVHGFAFALLIGVVVGTYSSIAVAAPLLYRPKLLHVVVVLMIVLGLAGIVVELTPGGGAARWIPCGIIAVVGAYALMRVGRGSAYAPAGRVAGVT